MCRILCFVLKCFGENHALNVHVTWKSWQLFSELDGPQILLVVSLVNRQNSRLCSRDNESSSLKTLSQTYDYWLKNKHWDWYNLRCGKNNNRRKQNFKDQAPCIVTISRFFQLFAVIVLNYLTCSCLYDLTLRYKAQVNSLRASRYFINLRLSSVFHGYNVFHTFNMHCLLPKKDFVIFSAVWWSARNS